MARVVAGLCILVAGVVLTGWVFQLPVLTTFGRAWTPMVATTAFSVLFGALAILATADARNEPRWHLVGLLGALIAAIGGVTLADFSSVLIRDVPLYPPAPAWRMAPNTAIATFLLGGALVLMGRSRRRNAVAEALLVLALLLALNTLLAFLFGATPTSDLMGRVNMSPITGLCLSTIAATLLFQVPHGAIARAVTGVGPGSRIARPLLALVVIAPLLFAWLRLSAQHRGWISLEYAVALTVLVTTSISAFAIFWYATRVNRYDAHQRRELEAQMFLARASELLAQSMDLKPTLGAVAELCVPAMADWCSIALCDGNGSLENVAVVHQDPAKVAWAKEYERHSPPDLQAPSGVGAVARTGKAEFFPEIPDALLTGATKDAEQVQIIRALGLRSAMSVPLIAGARTIGVLTLVTSESGRQLTQDDLRTAQQLADRCAAAIDRARLFGEVATELKLRKAAEEEQRREHGRYRTLFEASPLPMWMFDVGTLAFLEVNDAAVKHYGYSASEFLGMTMRDIRPPDEQERLQRNMAELRASGTVKGGARHRKKDGTVIEVEGKASSLTIEGREVQLAVVTDVTARKQAEDALHALTAELEQRVAQRTAELAVTNRELESFSYSVSHDLRTPLRALDGFSQALLEDYGDRLDDAAKDYLGRIRRGSQRMGDLIDSLLDLSRVSRAQLQREPVDLTAIATDIIEMLRERAPDRDVRTMVRPGMTATGDPRLLRALLQNLLANAWKFSAKRTDARIEFTTEAENGRTQPVYVVRDNGAGFDMSYASKLFGAFQRLHAAKEFEGTGVGLATVQRIVHRHAGEIWAKSAPEQGAAFYFTLSSEGHGS